MIGNSQDKPIGRFNWGPETEPQVRQMYHGLGDAPVYVYKSNPFSWRVLGNAIVPFLDIQTGNRGRHREAQMIGQLERFVATNAPRGGAHDKSGGQR